MPVTASTFTPPLAMCGSDVSGRIEDRLDMAGEQVAHRRREAGIGDVDELDAGRGREPLHLQVRRAS